MYQLTFWEYPKGGQGDDPEAFDGIFTAYPKSVKEIPELIAHMPKNCKMISLERSAPHKKNGKVVNPKNPKYFKELWRVGQPIPEMKLKKCPMCGKEKE